MVKGGKQYSSMSNDGKWFAHPVSCESETRNRETCTSTGIMLSQGKSSLPQALNFKRHAKYKTQQETREFPFSEHDNKRTLKDSICVFSNGLGHRKCSDEHRRNTSHFCLCHDGAEEKSTDEIKANITVYQADFMEKQAVNGPTNARRFPHNHQQKSAAAALAQPSEQFMWFGRHDSVLLEKQRVLPATRSSASSKS